jgi:hypothetical protein
MKLSVISESKNIPYYKVMVGEKPKVITPGYMTSDAGTVIGYLSAFISSANGPGGGGVNQPVWVVKADIDVNQLKQIDGLIFLDEPDEKIKPGYYGTETSPEDGIDNILDVIVITQPTKIDIVGGYIPELNYDFKSGKMNSYIETGNAWKFEDDLGNFDDFKLYDYK